MFAMTYFSVVNQFSQGAINIVRNAFLIFVFSGIAAAQTCPPLPVDKTSALVAYVRKEYKINDTVDLKLLKQEPFGNTCYHALTFEGKTRGMPDFPLKVAALR